MSYCCKAYAETGDHDPKCGMNPAHPANSADPTEAVETPRRQGHSKLVYDKATRTIVAQRRMETAETLLERIYAALLADDGFEVSAAKEAIGFWLSARRDAKAEGHS